ncbi:MAG: DUF21 domain-containing protein [Xanthomonadaceae bacterium]|nr:DUF21 domain-containing protein [Xanthomonadaceae bacterium]
MSDVPIGLLAGALIALVALSAVLSASETGVAALSRHRLRQLAKSGNRSARRLRRLLGRPHGLSGLMQHLNTLTRLSAAAVATLLALRLGGGHTFAAVLLVTFVALIVAEIAAKKLAALYPEQIAFPASFALTLLMRLLQPLVRSTTGIANGLLRLFGIRTDSVPPAPEMPRGISGGADDVLSQQHQEMVTNLLDLANATVEDIMAPRSEIVGIDLEDGIEDIVAQLSSTRFTRLPVFRGSIEQVEGVIHVRRLLPLVLSGAFDKEQLIARVREPYFIPEGTPLHIQLLNFQRNKRSFGLVVDEYGDILGLVTLEDILEEIVGDFTDPLGWTKQIQALDDGSYLVEGSTSVRELNRVLDWNLPTDGPKTLNGVILEQLEAIPQAGVSLRIAGMPVTILQTSGYKVKTAQVFPAYRRNQI